MRKIMLVIDDFKELVALESLLRRLGFDVLSLGKDLLVNDALLRFSPDLVIATARGRAVDGVKLSHRLRKVNPAPRMVLGFSLGQLPEVPPDAKTTVDAICEFPVQPETIIRVIAQLSGAQPETMLAKFEKLRGSREQGTEAQRVAGWEEPDKRSSVMVSGGNSAASAKDTVKGSWDPVKTPGIASRARSERSDRYERFLKDNNDGDVSGVLPKDLASAAMDKLKKESAKDKQTLDSIEREKRLFAKNLFKTGKGEGGSEDG